MEKKRPLSPHLQIYKPQITSVLSIMHRFSGVGLIIGALSLSSWIITKALFTKYHQSINYFFSTSFGFLMIICIILAAYFHFFNGIRHLIWDKGQLMEMNQVRLSAWFIILLTLMSTLKTVVGIIS